MAYYLTPADRRARTQVMRMQRDPAYRRQKEKEEEERLEAARAASVQSTAAPSAVSEPEEEGNFFTKVLHTIGDVAANVVTGAGKGIEGIVDLGAGIGGAVAGIFSDDAENAVKDFIAKDHVGEWYGDSWQAALDQSALNNSKVGQIIEGVAQGVGQMLPAVAVTALTGAAFAPAALRAASTSLGLGTTIASAAGAGTEEAFQDGADYGKGLTYGAVSGAIEGVTEKMTGGVTKKVIGPGLLDDVIGKVAKTGVGRVAAGAVGEGVEEMLSEVANPTLKAIYKGSDALKEYGEGDFWAGVGEAGIIGAGTSLAYGGTVGKVMRTSGVYADANNVLEHIDEQENRIAKGDLSAEQEVKARESIKKDYKLLETRLAKAKPEVRERVLKNPTLAAAFDTSGALKQDFVARMEADAAAAADTTYDRAYRSSTLSAAEIDGVVQKANGQSGDVQNANAKAGTKTTSGAVRAFTGTLTEAQSKKNAELREMMGTINKRSGGKVKYFLAENTGENGFIDPDTGIVAIDVSTLESGKAAEQILKGEVATELWRDTAIHETGHATEGTVSHALFTKHIKGNDTVYNKAVNDFIARGYFGTDMDAARKRFDTLVEKLENKETLTDAEKKDLNTAQSEIASIAAANVLNDADFVKRLVKGEPSRAEKILGKIVQIKNALTGNSEANKEIAFVRKAEKLYLDAIAELGGTYRDGKIHLANREEDEAEENKKSPAEGEVKYSFRGYAQDGKGIYEGNFPKGTPKAAKSEKILSYIKNVWSKDPIKLVVSNGETSRTILAKFDPTIDESKQTATDASKLAGGNRHGNHTEQRVTLDLADDYYQIASEAEYNYSKLETGKKLETHDEVKMWHYFVNDIYFVEHGAEEMTPYTVTINVKEKADGDFVYSFNAEKAEKEFSTRQTLHADVSTRKGANGELFLDNSITENEPIVKPDTQENSGEIKFSRKVATFTHRDVNEMLSTVRGEALTFTLEDGTEIKGAIASKNGQELNTWLYDTLNTANLKDKRALARQIADRILNAAITDGKQPLREAIGEEASTLVREDLALSVAAVLGDKQAQSENRRKNAHFDAMRKIAEEMRDVEKGRFYSATIYDGDTLRAIPNMLRAALKTSRAFTGSIRNTLAKVKDWYCAEDNAMMYKPLPGEHNEGMANGQVVFDKDIAAMLEQLTDGKGALSVQELEMVVNIAKHFQKLSERYQKVFINGKWVDAEQLAEEMVSIMQTAQKEQNWIVRGLLNKYMRQFGDPAALFRAMDAYNPKGFYTKMHEWMRNAAISMQSDELHALKGYYEWHKKHKKWVKHLENDLIEFRGKKMTVGQLMTLYCESKTEKSKQGLADNGFKFTDKDGVPHRIKGLLYEQAKGENASKKHDRADVQRACKQLENEIWNMLSEEQRAYIKLLEDVLNTTCRKWKIDTDTLMKGFSRVHERGYYFPSAHNGIAKTVDTTFYEGDRVGHLSLNKEAVEGARGELIIDGIDNVVLRHVRNMALYKNYAIVAENRSMLQNIDVGSVDGKGERIKNVHQAVTIRTTSEEYGKYRGTDMMKLLNTMSDDLQGAKRAGQDEQSFLKDLVEEIRGNYARFQLGLNPKTLATQLSSLIAAGNILEYNCIVRGIKGFASKKTAQLVDKYCPLAELRNFDNTAAEASGLLEITGKHIGDVLMKGIGFVDRRVVCSLFYACQLQVQKDSKLALGSEENLKAAGELLTRVILETQQNSLVTEKSDAMRGGIFSRTFTMFTADGMKIIGRWIDSIGEWSVVSKRYRDAKRAGNTVEVENLEKELKRVHGQFVRSTSALAAQAVYMALISYLFRLLYDKDEEEVGENVAQGVVDFFGGLLGGLPIFRDIYSFFLEGYELDNFFLSTVNDVLLATSNAAGVARDAISGKDVSRQDVASAVRKVVYSSGQVLGIPVRNAYNVVTGLTRRFVPTAGYAVDSLFTAKAYSLDLKKAMEAGDDEMVARIASLMIDEKGVEDEGVQEVLRELIGKGYSVLPRSVGDSITVDGEKVALSGKQQKRFREFYRIGDDAVADMVKLKQFASADEAVQAKAVQFVHDVYWELAVSDLTGEDLAEKNVLFAEAIPIEKLAIIIATARAIEGDKDKKGNTIAGTKKRKVQTFVNSLRLTAAQKYMVMGYLGYSNVNGAAQVKSYIGRLGLSKKEQAALMKYSGYAE